MTEHRGEILIDFAQVKKITSLSRSTIWRMEQRGEFPKRLQISARRVGWILREVAEFNDARIAINRSHDSVQAEQMGGCMLGVSA